MPNPEHEGVRLMVECGRHSTVGVGPHFHELARALRELAARAEADAIAAGFDKLEGRVELERDDRRGRPS